MKIIRYFSKDYDPEKQGGGGASYHSPYPWETLKTKPDIKEKLKKIRKL